MQIGEFIALSLPQGLKRRCTSIKKFREKSEKIVNSACWVRKIFFKVFGQELVMFLTEFLSFFSYKIGLAGAAFPFPCSQKFKPGS